MAPVPVPFLAWDLLYAEGIVKKKKKKKKREREFILIMDKVIIKRHGL